jgi:hypothetical protein
MHPDQYQLSFVNEAWFKGLLFETYNSSRQGRREMNSSEIFADIDGNLEHPQVTSEATNQHFLVNKEKQFAACAPNT